MTKTKSSKRALLMSALSLLMCVSMLIGSTFAWFTDSVASGNNKIVAGNLDVALYHTNGTDTDEEVNDTTKLFDEVALWEPGAMVWEKLTVRNLGSLALKYTLSVNVSDVSVVNGKSLADVLKVAVMTEQPTRDNIKTATTQDLETFALKGEGVLDAKTGVDTFYVAIYWAPTADDNDYNIAGEQLYATLGVNLLATQATVEKDSFDEKYDADASFDDVIFANGGTYVMENDRDEGIVISSGATVVINGEGNTLNTTGDAGLINEGNATVNDVVMNAGSASNYSNITRGEDAKTTYNDVTLNSAGGGVGAVDGAEVIFNSGSVEVNTKSTSGRYLFYAEGEGTVITINGGNFADFTKTSQNQKRAYIYAGEGTTVYVNGGTFGKASTRSGYTAGILGTGNVVIKGGTFGFNPTTWVASGYKAAPNGSSWIVIPETAELATDNATFSTAIQNGADTVYLGSGDYTIPAAAKGKTLTIVGTGDTSVAVTKVGNGGENCDFGLDGSTVVFENVTITTNSSTYIGYARCNGTYNNCTINGTYTLYGNSLFNNCTFNVSGDVYNIWTWGAPTATFNNCTFNSDGKAVLLYGTANTKLTVNGCTFNDNGGLTDLKAAIEIGNDYGKSYELIVNDTTVNGYEINDKGINTGSTLWANKNSMGQDKLNVVVDGVDVY